jgi:hypothetical protein
VPNPARISSTLCLFPVATSSVITGPTLPPAVLVSKPKVRHSATQPPRCRPPALQAFELGASSTVFPLQSLTARCS